MVLQHVYCIQKDVHAVIKFYARSHTLSLTKPPDVNTPASSNATRTLFWKDSPYIKCKHFNNKAYYKVARELIAENYISIYR